MEINKVPILDSGCNYSVLSNLEHNDLDSKLELSDILKVIESAGSQSINIKSIGRMVEIPAVYAPDATVSMTSVRQYCAGKKLL